jgi:hypothetical protein
MRPEKIRVGRYSEILGGYSRFVNNAGKGLGGGGTRDSRS